MYIILRVFSFYTGQRKITPILQKDPSWKYLTYLPENYDKLYQIV